MKTARGRAGVAFASFALLITLTWSPAGAIELPPRPEPYEVISDAANLVAEADERAIRTHAAKAREATGAPFFVATIPSLAAQDAANWTMERYAAEILGSWAGAASNGKEALLLVSLHDRKARIELGPGWGTSLNATSLRIMDEILLPSFRDGAYSSGTALGVGAITAMLRGEKPPGLTATSAVNNLFARHGKTVLYIIGITLVLSLFALVGPVRRGYGGYGYDNCGWGHHHHSSGGGWGSSGGSWGSSSSSSTSSSSSGRGASGSW